MLPDGEERVTERDQRLFPSRLPKWARMPEAIPFRQRLPIRGDRKVGGFLCVEQ